MRYRLRTLLILLAVGPMVLAWVWWAVRIGAWRSWIEGLEIVGYVTLLFAPIATLMAVAWIASQISGTKR